ncbi:hypothetical protein [Actinomadura madurae]|uniref:hypothetical protein n=2 Tax=Actinomadura madurae TaxID=1993 RepID=UPI002026A57F|nr:hypothetical protein [Actinomadura madurae]MCP9949863.1 hypothetical protein [Actinomadura madurae]MCP9966614.1 hypothetical protein [Actinomadura madurae]MCQ0009365.1 hypothetical protein [Actinomadura madurae]MCQ0015291.1 hypothetical protein [Actinomadura madurae]URM95437.1 hypothetical protein LUW76_14520 [Actinomadura madurae]
MDPALAGLAGAVGAALVEAMATDFWGTARTRLARIIGRGAPAAEADLTRELEESAGRLGRQSPPERTALEAEQARWTALLTAFLVEHVEASAELQDFVAQVRRALADTDTVHVVQNITANRNAFIAGRDQHISIPQDPMDADGR